MIARIRGKVVRVREQAALIEVGPVWYELLVPPSVAKRLPRAGEEATLYVFAYIEGGQMSSASHQRLIGFLDEIEREFFELLIKVGGLGMKKAARAMAMPVSQIANAIERGDDRSLRGLPEVGPTTAKKIIAELQGKAGKFALLRDTYPEGADRPDDPGPIPAAATGSAASAARPGKGGKSSGESLNSIIEDAHKVLTQLLHYGDRDAQDMINRALDDMPQPEDSDALVQKIFQLTRNN